MSDEREKNAQDPNKHQLNGAKPKLVTNDHKVQIQQQMIKCDRKQQNVKKPKISLGKARIKSTLKLGDLGVAYVIVPLPNKMAWVSCEVQPHLLLIDSTGKLVTKSVALDHVICDAKKYASELLVTCYGQCKVYKMSKDGLSASTFSDFSPYNAKGLCVTQDMEVLVCLRSTVVRDDSKVVRLNKSGNVIDTIQYDANGAPLFRNPWFVTSISTGEVFVSCSQPKHRIIGVTKKGQHLFTWEGEIPGQKLDKYCVLERITHDSNDNLIVADCHNNRVYMLEKDGSWAMCLSDKTWWKYRMCLFDNTQWKSSPVVVTGDNQGQLWVGCSDGNIYIMEY